MEVFTGGGRSGNYGDSCCLSHCLFAAGDNGLRLEIILLGMVSLLMDGLAMYYLGLDWKERKLLASQLKKIYGKYK